ncbi:NERD domain-containing protein [Ruania suaedae]|uniref:nuclease-related domain-containing protein n=1 Tax=Ruania suaedae TaxID=2897774 RepID=UPI001E4C0159|nr:nuclease-related domain-containing protein [Ruania suaedae]UFU01864.1 NERD domain-containing protein [Ruania suaedae]
MTEDTPTKFVGERMKLRYAGRCRLCGSELPARADAIYERANKTVRCVACPAGTPVAESVDEAESASIAVVSPDDAGVAGSSARREYERRKARNEQRLRQKWGKLGGVAVAFSEDKQRTKAWATGAVGEERLGAHLDALASESIAVLHDRRIPGSRANIDHMAITPAGIWVIDAKKYKGRPLLRVEGGILRPRVEKLLVGRRDCTQLVDGVINQVDLVRAVVGDLPVTGVLCFVDADWPLIGGDFTTRGVHTLWPRRLTKLLAAGEGGAVDVPAVREALASHFQPA